MYLDNTRKTVAVLNKKLPMPQLLNALGHCTQGLMHNMSHSDLSFVDYQASDGTSHGMISTYPFIVLQADNSNHIASLRQQCIAQGIPYTDFVETMIGHSSEQQLQDTKHQAMPDVQYVGIVMHESTEILKPLIKKFSLFRGS